MDGLASPAVSVGAEAADASGGPIGLIGRMGSSCENPPSLLEELGESGQLLQDFLTLTSFIRRQALPLDAVADASGAGGCFTFLALVRSSLPRFVPLLNMLKDRRRIRNVPIQRPVSADGSMVPGRGREGQGQKVNVTCTYHEHAVNRNSAKRFKMYVIHLFNGCCI